MLCLERKNFCDFDEIYKDMKEQFPAAELKSFSDFKKLFSKETYRLYIAKDDTKTVGYTVVYCSEEEKFLWLDYVAVKKAFQSGGYGKKIFSELQRTFSTYKGIYAEIEKPDTKNPDTIRRINFYTKLGAKKLECRYFYPNNGGGLEMDLYFIPFSKNNPESEFTKAVIKKVFSDIHQNVRELQKIMDKMNL